MSVAKLIKQLREETGAPMMDCKKAIEESGGSIEDAKEYLRKTLSLKLKKFDGRETSEGVVGLFKNETDVIVIKLECETDFVAKCDDMTQGVARVGQELLDNVDQYCDGSSLNEKGNKLVEESILELKGKIKENIKLAQLLHYSHSSSNWVIPYLHFTNKLASVVVLDRPMEDQERAEKLAMHVAAMKPGYLSREEISQEVIDKERAIYQEEFKDKPEVARGKIVEGKLGKYFKENCFLDQDFAFDDYKTVLDALGGAKVVTMDLIKI